MAPGMNLDHRRRAATGMVSLGQGHGFHRVDVPLSPMPLEARVPKASRALGRPTISPAVFRIADEIPGCHVIARGSVVT